MKIKKLASKYEEYIINTRRYLHQNPEPTWQEYKTSDFIEEELKNMGISTKRFDKPGVVGILKGEKPEKTVALRADMDALPIKEETDLPFKSTNDCMHACGHDCHMAMILGAAKILSSIKDDLKGNVKFIFQPAEERCEGARYLIKKGVLDDVDAIFGMHIWGNFEAGKINIEPGPRLSSGDIFKIIVKGKSAHGSQPHLGADAIVASSAIIMNLQSIVSRLNDPMEPVVITVGAIKGGNRFNIIPKEVVLEGTTRAFNPEIRNNFEKIIRKIVKNTCDIYNTKGILEYIYSTSPVVNDQEISQIAQNSATKLFGKDVLAPYPKDTVCEDFALYCDHVPGAFASLGGGNKDKGLWYSNHDEKFDIDERALKIGAAVAAQFAVDFLTD